MRSASCRNVRDLGGQRARILLFEKSPKSASQPFPFSAGRLNLIGCVANLVAVIDNPLDGFRPRHHVDGSQNLFLAKLFRPDTFSPIGNRTAVQATDEGGIQWSESSNNLVLAPLQVRICNVEQVTECPAVLDRQVALGRESGHGRRQGCKAAFKRIEILLVGRGHVSAGLPGSHYMCFSHMREIAYF